MSRAIAAALTVLSALALALVGGLGCGGQDPDDPAAAIGELQSAFEDRDLGAICRRMTASAREEAGSVAHGAPTTCRPDLKRAFDTIERGGRWGPEPELVRVDTAGDRATAILETDDGWRAEVPLAREKGTWKLAAFFGAGPPARETFYKAAPRNPFPVADGDSAVEVLDRRGRPCRELAHARDRTVPASCGFSVEDQSTPLRMLTPFGDFKFGNCSLEYEVHIDGRGRTWTNEWDVDGNSATGCADVIECVDQEEFPWKGRLVSDGRGGFLHRVDACVRTCIGMFVGEIVTRLARHGRGWRVEPTQHGATGFQFDGAMGVEDGDFDVQPG